MAGGVAEGVAAGEDRSDLATCAAQVRRHDHDRYLSVLFAPAAARNHLFALYAFNLEVAKVPEVVSEAMLGQIRLQWWRESLEGIYAGSPRRHEVVTPLDRAVRSCGLTRAHLDRLIDTREADLDPAPPASLTELEAYAEGSAATLVVLALEILGARDASSQEAGRHLGAAWALSGLLRAIPFHAQTKRVYLPQDLSRAAGLNLGDLFRGEATPALKHVVHQLSQAAAARLLQARSLAAKTDRKALPGLLLGRLIDRHLTTLRACDHDPFAAKVQAPRPGNAWRLLTGAVLRRY